MLKEIYISDRHIKYYVNISDNTANIEYLNNSYFKYIGFVIIDILNDLYDLIYDNIIEDSKYVVIYINNKSKDNHVIDFDIYKYINKYKNLDVINQEMFKDLCINNKYNYTLVIRYNNFEDLIIY